MYGGRRNEEELHRQGRTPRVVDKVEKFWRHHRNTNNPRQAWRTHISDFDKTADEEAVHRLPARREGRTGTGGVLEVYKVTQEHKSRRQHLLLLHISVLERVYELPREILPQQEQAEAVAD